MSVTKTDDVYGEFSAFYDLYVGDWLGDLPLYLEHASRIQSPVLEVGAGSGRLTVPLAKAGHEVVAVDTSPSMLKLLGARLESEDTNVRNRVRIVETDLCDLDLAAQYDLILVPYYTFNYLLTPQRQREAMCRLRQHLASSGRILIDVHIPRRRLIEPTSEPALRLDTVDPATGGIVRAWNSYRIDARLQIEHRTQSFEVTRQDGTVRKCTFVVRRRYDFPGYYKELFRESGFSVEQIATGYEGAMPVDDSEQLLFTLAHRDHGVG